MATRKRWQSKHSTRDGPWRLTWYFAELEDGRVEVVGVDIRSFTIGPSDDEGTARWTPVSKDSGLQPIDSSVAGKLPALIAEARQEHVDLMDWAKRSAKGRVAKAAAGILATGLRRSSSPESQGPKRGRPVILGRDHDVHVAEVYLAALAAGGTTLPVRAVMKAFEPQPSEPTAYRWVHAANRAGLIPDADMPGAKAKTNRGKGRA